jgi:hypothetical protein
LTHQSANSIAKLKKQHEDLYTELLHYRAGDKAESGAHKEQLATDVNTLLDKLEAVTPEVRLLNDYTWLINATVQWQAFAALLNIHRRIKIPEPPDELWAPTQRLGKEDVDQWLVSRQRDICRLRHLKRFLWHVRNVTVEPSDVYYAKAYFAKDTLSGAKGITELDVNGHYQGIDLIEKVPPDAYRYLEDVWFRDIIRLDAYLIWEVKGAVEEWPAEWRKSDFLEACEKYRKLLADQDVKRGPEKFGSIQEYLTEKYLDSNKKLRPTARDDIIRIKAEQMARIGGADSRTNWEETAPYVDDFYNNIVPAVVEADGEAWKGVRQAILRSEGRYSRASIMNVFEAAICIYFLKGFEYFAADWNV